MTENSSGGTCVSGGEGSARVSLEMVETNWRVTIEGGRYSSRQRLWGGKKNTNE